MTLMNIRQAEDAFAHDLDLIQTKHTIRTYLNGLKRFNGYLDSVNISITDDVTILATNHVIGYSRFLTEPKSDKKAVSASTLHTYLSSLIRFYTYLSREGLVEYNVRDWQILREAYKDFRNPKRKDREIPTDQATRALLQAAREMPSDPKKPRLELVRLRNIAILEALRASGMRVGELVGLRRGDLDHQSRSARVTGKGDKERNVYFDDIAWAALQTYFQARADGASGRALVQLPVFARHDRRAANRVLPMTTDAVRLVFNLLAHRANLDIQFTPHSFRHAFATRVLEETNDLAVVQDMLGHASPVTTRIYAKVSTKRLREVHRRVFDSHREDEAE